MSTTTNKIYVNGHFTEIPFLTEIMLTSKELAAQPFIVGGTVRDAIMNRPLVDVDIIPFGVDYTVFARILGKKARAFTIPFKDNVRLVKGDLICDVSKPRGADIFADLLKRDFTINNLAMNLSGEIFGDPHDIEKGIIRAVFNGTFDDDPLRVLRCFRFASVLGFQIEEGTKRLAIDRSYLLPSVAEERIWEELQKIFTGKFFSNIAETLMESGALTALFPKDDLDIASALRIKEREGETGEDFSPMMLSALLGAGGAKRLKLSVKDIKTAEYMVKYSSQIESLVGADTRSIMAALWHHYERAEKLLIFTAAKYPCKKKDIDNMAKLIPLLKYKEASAINGALLESIGFRPGPLFKEIITHTAEKLALDELTERELKEYIIKKYGGNI